MHRAACLLMGLILLSPLASARSICEDSWDDVSVFGVVGADSDGDGNGKAVCVGNLGVNADDGVVGIPGGLVVWELVSLCENQSCEPVVAAAVGAYVLTTGGFCIIGGVCPKAGVFVRAYAHDHQWKLYALP